MANRRPLSSVSGTTAQVGESDLLLVGSGIDSVVVGNLTIGSTIANSVTIGSAVDGVYWDGTNARLGIGAGSSPIATFDARINSAQEATPGYRLAYLGTSSPTGLEPGVLDMYNNGLISIIDKNFAGEKIYTLAVGTQSNIASGHATLSISSATNNTVGIKSFQDAIYAEAKKTGAGTIDFSMAAQLRSETEGGNNAWLGALYYDVDVKGYADYAQGVGGYVTFTPSFPADGYAYGQGTWAWVENNSSAQGYIEGIKATALQTGSGKSDLVGGYFSAGTPSTDLGYSALGIYCLASVEKGLDNGTLGGISVTAVKSGDGTVLDGYGAQITYNQQTGDSTTTTINGAKVIVNANGSATNVFGTSITIGGAAGVNSYALHLTSNSGADNTYLLYANAPGSVPVVITGNRAGGTSVPFYQGRLGVGLNNPSSRLHVHSLLGPGEPVVTIQNNTSNWKLYSGTSSPQNSIAATVGSVLSDATNGVLYFKQSGSSTSGWVSVATTASGVTDFPNNQVLLGAGSGGQIKSTPNFSYDTSTSVLSLTNTLSLTGRSSQTLNTTSSGFAASSIDAAMNLAANGSWFDGLLVLADKTGTGTANWTAGTETFVSTTGGSNAWLSAHWYDVGVNGLCDYVQGVGGNVVINSGLTASDFVQAEGSWSWVENRTPAQTNMYGYVATLTQNNAAAVSAEAVGIKSSVQTTAGKIDQMFGGALSARHDTNISTTTVAGANLDSTLFNSASAAFVYGSMSTSFLGSSSNASLTTGGWNRLVISTAAGATNANATRSELTLSTSGNVTNPVGIYNRVSISGATNSSIVKGLSSEVSHTGTDTGYSAQAASIGFSDVDFSKAGDSIGLDLFTNSRGESNTHTHVGLWVRHGLLGVGVSKVNAAYGLRLTYAGIQAVNAVYNIHVTGTNLVTGSTANAYYLYCQSNAAGAKDTYIIGENQIGVPDGSVIIGIDPSNTSFPPEASLHVRRGDTLNPSKPVAVFENDDGKLKIYCGNPSGPNPNGNLTAVPGSLLSRADVVSADLWIKASSTGNTGWEQILTTASNIGVTAVTATSPLDSSGGATPVISILPGTAVNDVLKWDGTNWVIGPVPGGGGGGVTSVSATAPLASSGGTTPTVSFPTWPANTAGVLQNDGSGGLTWATGAPATGAAGAQNDIQYNGGSGTFAASSNFTFDTSATPNLLTLTGQIIQSGGSFSFSGDAGQLTATVGDLDLVASAGSAALVQSGLPSTISFAQAEVGTYSGSVPTPTGAGYIILHVTKGAFTPTNSTNDDILLYDPAVGTLKLGAGTAVTDAVSIGRSGITTTITGGLTQNTGAFSLTGNGPSQISTTSGKLDITSALKCDWSSPSGVDISATSGTMNLSASTMTIQAGATNRVAVNSNQLDSDFRVSSVNNLSCLLVDASLDRVSINGEFRQTNGDVNLTSDVITVTGDAVTIQATSSNAVFGTLGPTNCVLQTNNIDRLVIDSNQYFFNGIGSGTGTTANILADDQLVKLASSIRYKRDVETLDSNIADGVLSLRPVWYRSKCAVDRQDWSWYGLIAEEVETVDPRLVGYVKDPQDSSKLIPDSVAYDRLSVLLLDIVKRQKTKIETLEQGLEAQKARTDALEKEIESLKTSITWLLGTR